MATRENYVQYNVQQNMATRGSNVQYGKILGGIPKMLVFIQFSQNIGFRQNNLQSFSKELIQVIQLYKQNLLEIFFFFTIYQNYWL